jgi:hypothetical protein
MFFLILLLDDGRILINISDFWIRIQIREAQKHIDPMDPDPQHCLKRKKICYTPETITLYLDLLAGGPLPPLRPPRKLPPPP